MCANLKQKKDESNTKWFKVAQNAIVFQIGSNIMLLNYTTQIMQNGSTESMTSNILGVMKLHPQLKSNSSGILTETCYRREYQLHRIRLTYKTVFY